ncbi:putative ABC transporter ATP-binding protein [Sulfuracidifex tepidarius]|uniref:ABC transporter ATP-binding protein n=1 Tax=Sulfuracidifex tepidarius TaxID=1294262 RepID=A0A510DS28_9CREN|nr:ABC transporter ATP-binding protein [Sulfuracidifex tepidarius]BBG22991.1 putative ABC transporter ATP-binding protein [Sulfuracidifex tepidarius]
MDGIIVSDIVKVYKAKGREIRALDGVSFRAEKGEITSIVGHNGAGKTTMLKILSTLVIPTSGTATVNGYDVVKDEKRVRENIGLVTVSDRLFYYRLTGMENLVFFGSLQGLSISEAKRRAKEVLDIVGLTEWRDTPYMKYSTGMQRRLALARAILTDPPVILLDEPTLGLDPVSARIFRENLQNLGKTVLMTSHYLKEVEDLSKNVIVFKRGKVVAKGDPEQLKSSIGKVYEGKVYDLPHGMEKFVVRMEKEYAVLRLPEREMGKVELYDLKEVTPTMDDVYVFFVEEGIDVAREGRKRGGARWRE